MVFHVFFQHCFPTGTLLMCDHIVFMLRFHLAKLIKRIPLRFTHENQINFPYCSVNCIINGTFYGTKMVFMGFFNIAPPPLEHY